MGRLKILAQMLQEFATNHVAEPDVPLVAVGDGRYEKSTKIALLLLKEEIDKPLRNLKTILKPHN